MLSSDENAVRLMTAHVAKGLEFEHVFILRANSNSFPCSYKEPLVSFPRELHDADSIAQDDDKTLHDQEERRLFYVAMTRARDSLTIHSRQGRGSKDQTPSGFMRDLMKDHSLLPWLSRRGGRGFQTDMFGEAATAAPLSRLGEWLSLPPDTTQNIKLSASALESYETCPLQFKLEREWRIPGEIPAAMQFGGSMHRVLRAYYDSVRFGRPMTEESLIEMFRADLAAAKIQDPYQEDLYQKQGRRQLQEFLAACRRGQPPDVMHTEEFFEAKIGESIVVGRIDRIDRIGDRQVLITDYKTGKPKSQEDADQSLQLSIYALAAAQKWGYEVDQLCFYNLEENSAVITRRSALQLTEARAKVEEVSADIADGKFEPKPGFHCRFCAYRNLCPATEKHIQSNKRSGSRLHQKT
jgi:ATP-dependent exoDNAse (exonuclease V) beta subunit